MDVKEQPAIFLTVEGVRTRASTNEALVTFAVPLEQANLVSQFMGLIGKQVAAAFAEIGADTKPVRRTEESYASRLHRLSFFNNPKLWEALEREKLVSQNRHKAHLKTLYCALKPDTVHELEAFKQCKGDIVPHHVRNAANAGTSKKPLDWYCVPLCDLHHKLLHAGNLPSDRDGQPIMDYLLAVASGLAGEAMKTGLKLGLKRDSLSGLDREELRVFLASIGYDGVVP